MALSSIANRFAEHMPFNKLMGMQVSHCDVEKVGLRNEEGTHIAFSTGTYLVGLSTCFA